MSAVILSRSDNPGTPSSVPTWPGTGLMPTKPLLALAGFGALALVCQYRPRWITGPPVAALLWAALVAALGIAAWRAAGVLAGSSRRERLVAAGLLFNVAAAQVVVLPGLLGALRLSVQVVLVGVLFALAWQLPGPATLEPSSRTRDGGPSALGVAASGLFALAWSVTVLNQIRYTVQDSDNMWYHLPMVAEWIRTGSVWPKETIPLLARAYPGFHEAVLTFFSLPLKHEGLALPGIVELPLLAVTVSTLCLRLGASGLAALAAGTYAATVPVVVAYLPGNDVALALYFAMALLFVLRRPGTVGSHLLAGLALGALAATKFSGVFYAGLAAALAGAARLRAGEVTPTRRLARFGLVLGAAALVAGPWYARNAIAYGNWFYPAELRLGGLVLWPGPLPPDYFAPTRLGWNLTPLITLDFLRAFGALGPLLAVGPLLALVVALRRRRVDLAALALVAVASGIVFLQQPFSADGYGAALRYLLPWFVASLVSTLGLAGAVATPEARPGLAATTGLTLVAGMVVNLALWTRWWWVLAAVATAVAATARVAWPGTRRLALALRPRVAAATVIIGLGCVAVAVDQVRAHLRYHPDYGYRDASGDRGWGPVAAYVHRTLRESRIAVTGGPDFFPLYGADLSNTVFPLKGDPSPAEVLAFCREVHADYLVAFVPVVRRLGRWDFVFGAAVAPALLQQYPDTFSVVFERHGAYVLKVHLPGRSLE